jgi:cell division protein FtsZ
MMEAIQEIESAATAKATPDYRIRVCGLGGAGGNVVQTLLSANLEGFETVVVNTDAKALETVQEAESVWLGRKVTRGFGTGGVLSLGERIAAEERIAFDAMVEGVDCLISVTGMGGGTGTAFADALAAAAVRADVLHLAFVFHPFSFEGAERARIAEEASGRLRGKVHGLIVIPNDLILQTGGEQVSAMEAFDEANRWIVRALRALGLMIFKPGLMRQDLASLAVTLGERGGRVLFGLGEGRGEDPVKAALKSLEQCPFLEIESGRTLDQLLIQVTGGPSMGMVAVQRLIASLRERFSCRESIRFGASIDPEAGDAIRVCLLGKMEIGRAKKNVPVVDSRDTSMLFPGDKEEAAGNPAVAVHVTKLQKRKAAKKQASAIEQEEFDFITDNSVQRGLFEKSERNFYGDEDLDVPTFLRKGVRIRVL